MFALDCISLKNTIKGEGKLRRKGRRFNSVHYIFIPRQLLSIPSYICLYFLLSDWCISYEHFKRFIPYTMDLTFLTAPFFRSLNPWHSGRQELVNKHLINCRNFLYKSNVVVVNIDIILIQITRFGRKLV